MVTDDDAPDDHDFLDAVLRRAAVFCALLVSFAGAQIAGAAPMGLPTFTELEAGGAVIGEIHLIIHDVFDPEDPGENKKIFKLANRLHINTRESAIRAQLLFRSGDLISNQTIEETERNLRALDYLFDADIRVRRVDGNIVDLEVVTRDVWTLNPGFSFDRKGGVNTWEYELEEENLLGRGKSIAITRSRDLERSSLLAQWSDPNIWGSRWRNHLTYSSNDDGHLRSALVERPFFSLDTRWSSGLYAFEDNRVDPRYNLGEIVDEFRHHEKTLQVYGGWSTGLVTGWTRRWLGGWRYEQSRFSVAPDRLVPLSLPPDRKLSYPWVGVEWIEDRYEQTSNLNQIGRTEDLYYGRSFRVELGWAADALGADREAAIVAASGRAAFKFTELQSLFLSTAASGRLESGEVADALIEGSASYFWRWRPKRVLSMQMHGALSDALDPEDQILLGGDNGLRGYPLRYQGGTARFLFTAEQRFYTDWYPFRLFNVGAAIFVDAGRVWGRNAVGTPNVGWLKDAGLGLRLGNARSSFGNVLHLDAAFPLDRSGDIKSVQFSVSTKRSF